MLQAVLFCLLGAEGALAQDAAPEADAPAQTSVQMSDAKAAYEQVLIQADALIKDGKPAAAYALLEPLEFAHAGEERFDYLIGIAALDSGRPDKATFALERVLTVNPNSAAARLDMARAYYQLGDMPRAKTEFLAVAQQDIPPAARANIEKYLDEIAVQESGGHTRLAGYVEGTAGHDSNVNFSTSQTQILVNSIPVGPITLAPSNLEAPDSYHAMAAGGEIRHSLDHNWELYASGDARKRIYSSQNQFDTLGLNAAGGVAYAAKAEHFRIGILDGRIDLGGVHSYDTTGLNGEWRHVFSPANQANLFLQATQYRYADLVMQPNDFDQQILGLGWTHVTVDGKTNLSGSLYAGAEQDVSALITAATPNGGRADGAKQFAGFRIGGQTAPGDTTTLFVGGGVQNGNYSRVNPLFLTQRKDRFSDLTLGANWSFAKRWTLRPQFNYSKNDSNIVINGYTRKEVSFTVRRDFR